MIKTLLIISAFLLGFNSNVFAQLPSSEEIMRAWVTEKKFRVKPSLTVGYNWPQEWNAEANLYFGMHKREGNPFIPTISGYYYRGIAFSGGAAIGGFKAGLHFYDFSALNGPAGYRIGPVLYMNNEDANSRPESNLLGIELDVYALLTLKAGVLRDLNSDKYITTAGLSIPFGPQMYK